MISTVHTTLKPFNQADTISTFHSLYHPKIIPSIQFKGQKNIINGQIVIPNHYQDRQNQHSKSVEGIRGILHYYSFTFWRLKIQLQENNLRWRGSRWWWRLKRRAMSPAAVDEKEAVSCWWWKRKEIVVNLPLLMKRKSWAVEEIIIVVDEKESATVSTND